MISSATGTRSPFPLPAIESPYRSQSRSRRLQQRFKRTEAITLLANKSVSSLNKLYMSFSSSVQAKVSSCSFVSSCQSRMLAHIYSCATRYVCRRGLGSSGSLPQCDDAYLFSGSSGSYFDFTLSYSAISAAAIPLIADRVSLPGTVGSAALLDLLPPDLVDVYSTPSALLRPVSEVVKTKRAVLCASKDEYVKLIRRMNDLGMVEFTTQPAVVNGVFGVVKDVDSIRLIIDARPANAVFVDPPHVELSTPDVLSKMCSDKPFYTAKMDLDNFYHRLLLPQWMRPYFALPAVTSDEVGLSDLFGSGTQVYPCCKTLPMGWSHSVYVAQRSHEHLLDTCTLLKPEDRLRNGNDLLLNRLRHQVYIDDINLFGMDPHEISRVQQQYITAMATHGLPVKPSKVVAPTQDGVECLGVMVIGADQEVGVSVPKLQKLVEQTISILSSGIASGLELSKLVGKWTWCMLVVRASLSVFSAVYKFIQQAGSRVFALWPSVRRELEVIVDMAPLLFTNLGANWFPKVIATDASEFGQGVVAARLDSDTMVQLAGLTPPNLPTQGEVVVEDVPTTLRESVTLELQPIVDNLSWSTIIASRWQRPEHINSLEIRAVSAAVRWMLSSPSVIGNRALLLCDSLVAMYSILKGRSSSRLLLPRLRQLASLVLGSGLQLFIRWIPTGINPADEPSRRYQF